MTSAGDDDEALRWEGDSQPAFVPAPKPTPEPIPEAKSEPAPDEPTTDAAPDKTGPVAEPEAAAPDRSGTPSILLVTYGIIAGAFLIYTIGWVTVITTAARAANPDPLGEISIRMNEILAIASPALWFGAAFLLTRGRKPIVRLLALLLGLVIVLPWPFVILGAS